MIAEATLKSCKVDDMSPQKAGETLGVDAVISGELTRIDGALFLRTELIDAYDGSQLCGACADATDLSGAQCDQELAEDVLKQLRPMLAPMAKERDSVVNLEGDRRAGVDRVAHCTRAGTASEIYSSLMASSQGFRAADNIALAFYALVFVVIFRMILGPAPPRNVPRAGGRGGGEFAN